MGWRETLDKGLTFFDQARWNEAVAAFEEARAAARYQEWLQACQMPAGNTSGLSIAI